MFHKFRNFQDYFELPCDSIENRTVLLYIYIYIYQCYQQCDSEKHMATSLHRTDTDIVIQLFNTTVASNKSNSRSDGSCSTEKYREATKRVLRIYSCCFIPVSEYILY